MLFQSDSIPVLASVLKMILAVAILASFFALWFLIFGFGKSCLQLPPGPKLSLPILGNSMSLGENMATGFARLKEMYGIKSQANLRRKDWNRIV